MPSQSTKRARARLAIVALSLAVVTGAACSDGPAGPQATFTVTEGTQALAAVPWPSDLLRDADGHIAISALPLDDTVVGPAILDDLNHEQDGFGVTTGAYFPVGRYQTTSFGGLMADDSVGTVDETTLAGNVHLFPLACADGHALDQGEVPVYTYLRAHDTPQRIYARPQHGVVLHERCTYGYVVTTKVRTSAGALVASDDLRALLSSGAPPARLQHAYDVFAPLRARLGGAGLTVDDVASATVFTTHTLTHDYLAARKQLLASPQPKATVTYLYARTKTAADDGTLEDLFGTPAAEVPGYDNAGGLSHTAIEYVIQGRYQTLDYLGGGTMNATGVESTAVGVVEHDGDQPRVKGTVSVPFTIVIPSGVDLTAVKFAVVQHGLGSHRYKLVTIAASLAEKGIGSILIDLPFHAARNKDAVDTTHEFTGAAGPDGFGDSDANAAYGFFDVTGNSTAGIPPVLPRAVRSAFFQSVMDLQQAFRLMATGDLSDLGARDPRLTGLKFDDTRELYVAVSFGSMIGTILSAFEPKLEGSVLLVNGGGLIFPLLLDSPEYGSAFTALLNGNLGTHAGDTADRTDTDWGYNLFDALIELGDGLSFSPYVVPKQDWGAASTETDHACHVLQLAAFHDESVPNPANLAVARGLGLQPLTLSDGMPPDLEYWTDATVASGSLSANAGGQTAAFAMLRNATHDMPLLQHDIDLYDLSRPDDPPFPQLPAPLMIDNPIQRVHALVTAFADAVLKGQAPTVQ